MIEPIIDASTNVGPWAEQVADLGVTTVIRYYAHRNSSSLPSKILTKTEMDQLHAAGLSVAVVFQQGGGAGGRISGLDAESGARDGARAMELAQALGQPKGSGIYFAVDHDFRSQAHLASIEGYARAFGAETSGVYRLGCYGSGAVTAHLAARDLIDFIWLAGARAWAGTREALAGGRYTIFQQTLEERLPGVLVSYDGNVTAPGVTDFGQWPLVLAQPAEPTEDVPSKRETVRAIQAALNAGGHQPALVVDGLPGPKTGAALAAVGFRPEHIGG